MPERRMYSKPKLYTGDILDFNTFGESDPPRVKCAETKEGKKIYRKETGEVHTIKEEKRMLYTLHEAGVSVEIPFEGGDPQVLYTLDEGRDIMDVLDSFDQKKRETTFAQIAQELAKIHNAGILHGDMHEKNIVYSKTGKIVFIDLELGHFIQTKTELPSMTDDEYYSWYASKLADEVKSLITSFEDLGKIRTNEKHTLVDSYLAHIDPKNAKIKIALQDKLNRS